MAMSDMTMESEGKQETIKQNAKIGRCWCVFCVMFIFTLLLLLSSPFDIYFTEQETPTRQRNFCVSSQFVWAPWYRI